MPLRCESQPDGSVLLWIKAVPGSSRDQISGLLGDRLKIRVSAAPEDGKANRAICACLAKALHLRSSQVSVHSGQSHPEKILRITGLELEQLRNALAKTTDV
jgi:uncharacterized protein (TIGR00251 family)